MLNKVSEHMTNSNLIKKAQEIGQKWKYKLERMVDRWVEEIEVELKNCDKKKFEFLERLIHENEYIVLKGLNNLQRLYLELGREKERSGSKTLFSKKEKRSKNKSLSLTNSIKKVSLFSHFREKQQKQLKFFNSHSSFLTTKNTLKKQVKYKKPSFQDTVIKQTEEKNLVDHFRVTNYFERKKEEQKGEKESEHYDKKFDEFRNEINNKIDLVMSILQKKMENCNKKEIEKEEYKDEVIPENERNKSTSKNIIRDEKILKKEKRVKKIKENLVLENDEIEQIEHLGENKKMKEANKNKEERERVLKDFIKVSSMLKKIAPELLNIFNEKYKNFCDKNSFQRTRLLQREEEIEDSDKKLKEYMFKMQKFLMNNLESPKIGSINNLVTKCISCVQVLVLDLEERKGEELQERINRILKQL